MMKSFCVCDCTLHISFLSLSHRVFEAVPGAEVECLAVLFGCPPSLLHDVFPDRIQIHIVPEGDVAAEGVSAAVALDYVCCVSLYHIVTIFVTW